MNTVIDQKAPEFSLVNTEGETVSLSKTIEKDNVVLLFFPLAFSSVCTEELCTIRDNMKLYNSMDAKVIGVSVDSHFTLNAFKKTENLNFTLLSDFNKSVAPKYDSLYKNFHGMNGVTKRSAFVINQDRKIKYKQVLDDAENEPDYKAIIETLSGLG